MAPWSACQAPVSGVSCHGADQRLQRTRLLKRIGEPPGNSLSALKITAERQCLGEAGPRTFPHNRIDFLCSQGLDLGGQPSAVAMVNPAGQNLGKSDQYLSPQVHVGDLHGKVLGLGGQPSQRLRCTRVLKRMREKSRKGLDLGGQPPPTHPHDANPDTPSGHCRRSSA